MKKTKFFQVLTLLTVFVMAGIGNAALVNVDFDNDKNVNGDSGTMTGAAAIGSAGDVWNGVDVGTSAGWPGDLAAGSLVDSAGAATGLTLSIDPTWVNGGWDNNALAATDAVALMGDYICIRATAGEQNSVDITIGGLAANSAYTLVLYGGGDAGNQLAHFTVDGVTQSTLGAAAIPLASPRHYVTFTGNVDGNGEIAITWMQDTGTWSAFNGFQLSVQGAAQMPSPMGTIDIDAVVNELTWVSGDVPDDPDLTVNSFDISYYSKLTADLTADDPNFANPANGVVTYTDVTSPYALAFDYDTTYFWRVDSNVTWVSTGADVIAGAVWTFDTLPSDLAPVVIIPEASDSILTWLANLPETGLAATVDDGGEGDLASVTWEIISGPGVPVAAAMQMVDRSGYLGNLAADPNLLRDWIGTDLEQGAIGNPMTLTLSGLPSGTYNWTSYHHDAQNQTGLFDVTVNDANGQAVTNDVDISTATEAVNTLSLTIVSDGSDVVLVFDKHPNSIRAEQIFVMNGFELTGSGDPLMIDFNQDINPDVMPGYQGYFAAHQDPATFLPQSYTALGSNVTVTPSWGYLAATVTDTTIDMTAPTATFDVTATPYPTTGLYTIQLTVEDAAAQMDSDTLQIRVAEDACLAAQTVSGFAFNDNDADNDCDVDLADFAVFAAQWLDDVSLSETLYD